MSGRKKILTIFQDVYDSLYQGEFLDEEITVKESTNLIGGDSILDSMGFVAMFAALEDELSDKYEKDIHLIIEDIIDFDMGSSVLTVGLMINYIEDLLNE